MTIHDRQGLKQTAAARLSEARFDPRLLMLIHTGVSLGATLLITAINYILNQQIAGTGGLSGIGLRSVLTTIQSALQLAVTVLLPFWEIGMVYSAIQIARGRSAVPADLMQGLRRFGPVLRLNLLRTGIYFAAAMPCLYLSVGIFTMTPLSVPMLQILEPIWEQAQASGTTPVLDDATMQTLMQTMTPVIFLFLGLFLLVTIPLTYRLRMADYVIMEDQKLGAMAAMAISWRMTRKRAFALFRLDLSFWWFYGLELLAVAVSYGDSLVGLLGLPISADAAYFVCYVLYVAATLALYWWRGSYVHTTYAVAYDTLRYQAAIPTPKPEPQPEHMPWDYNN